MMGSRLGMGMGMGMGWGWIFWLLLLAGIVLVVVVVVRAVGGGVRRDERPGGAGADGGRQGRSRAREIVDERYAAGELTTEEYRERLAALRENE